MDKQRKINEIYNILIQYEKISESDSGVTEQSYKNYLNRLWIWYIGFGNEEIANSIKGLESLGADAKHDTVKRVTFHLIDLLCKGDLNE